MCLSQDWKWFLRSSLDFLMFLIFVPIKMTFQVGAVKMKVDVKSISTVQSDTYQEKKSPLRGRYWSHPLFPMRLTWRSKTFIVVLKEETYNVLFVYIWWIHLWLCCGCRSSPEISCQSNCVGGCMLSLFLTLQGLIFLQVALLYLSWTDFSSVPQ